MSFPLIPQALKYLFKVAAVCLLVSCTAPEPVEITLELDTLSPRPGEQVTLRGAISQEADILTFFNGSARIGADARAPFKSRWTAEAGTHTLKVEAEVLGKLMGSQTLTVTVLDGDGRTPVANFSLDPTDGSGEAPLAITFDASASFDPDSDDLSYSWVFGDGNMGAGEQATHTFLRPGEFEVVLTVRDPEGNWDTASFSVVVTDSAAAQQIYQAGLQVWQRPLTVDKFGGRASCSACHGPDMLDLAYMNVADSDIVRRGVGDGLSQAEAEQLAAAVRGLRVKYDMAPIDPDAFRPFQPGGEALLPGATDAERDVAFGQTLETLLPTLMSDAPITSLGQAERARDELLALNPRDLKIGFDLPRWSEDTFHDEAREGVQGTIVDWVADLPRFGGEKRAEWKALQEAYLNDPSPLNFWRMYSAVPELTEAFPGIGEGARDYELNKYRTTLIGQHLMRAEVLQKAGQGDHLDEFLQGNPANNNELSRRFAPWAYLETGEYRNLIDKQEGGPNHPTKHIWDLGDVLRRNRVSGVETQAQMLGRLGFPNLVQDSVQSNYSSFNLDKNARAAWFWFPFMYDTSLNGGGGAIASGHYFSRTFETPIDLHGDTGEAFFGDDRSVYWIHRAFLNALRWTVNSYVPESGLVNQDGTWPSRAVESLSGHPIMNLWIPNQQQMIVKEMEPEQEQLYSRFTTNALSMMLYLYTDALPQQGNQANYGTYPPRFYTMAGCIQFAFEAYRPERLGATINQLEDLRLTHIELGANLPALNDYECRIYQP